ncbi:MAG: DUF4255 domain-containing protein [Candidatus Poribacteria bacterium]|nr:DUF4255 domain-containing protein [Candidatus Poribacteria bacterium]
MASYRAISAVGEAVIHLLRTNYRPEDFNNELEFRVYLPRDFSQPMAAGVSLFLYRVIPNGTHRIPSGRIGPDGRHMQTQLPLDLHFLLTAWGQDASLQHTITGWMIRTIEDTPILPAGLLNAVAPNVFQPDDTVEVILAELTNEDMFRIWETFAENLYQLSVPYIARNIRIESTLPLAEGELVQERTFDYREIRRDF